MSGRFALLEKISAELRRSDNLLLSLCRKITCYCWSIVGNLKHELDVVALKSARMSKTQLNTGRVQVGDLREVARLELLELLDRLLFSSSSEKLNFFSRRFPGTKALVWDSALTGPLGLIAEYQHLKEHEVKLF